MGRRRRIAAQFRQAMKDQREQLDRIEAILFDQKVLLDQMEAELAKFEEEDED